VAKRRQHGEGTIVKRKDGRWQIQITMPTGDRITRYARSAKEATNKLAELKREAEEGRDLTARGVTVGAFLTSWLEARCTLRPQTRQRYEQDIVLHINPIIGNIPLANLTAGDVQNLYHTKQSDLEESSIAHIHATLRAALKSAVRLDLVRRPVTSMIESPRNLAKEFDPLSIDETRQFIASIADNPFEAIYILALTTGMREGELLGLRWHDIDFKQGILHVRHTLVYIHRSFFLNEPKTKKGKRTIILTRVALRALHKHRECQVREKHALGGAWDSSWDLVFCNSIGKPIHRANVMYRFRKSLVKAGVTVTRPNGLEFRFHDLRHTGATLLMEAGIHPKVVSEMLGHSDIAVTLRVYSHVTQTMQQTAANTMDNLLGEIHPIISTESEIELLREEMARLREKNAMLSKLLSDRKNRGEE
jgi:integrase